jgi:hypothetical protein
MPQHTLQCQQQSQDAQTCLEITLKFRRPAGGRLHLRAPHEHDIHGDATGAATTSCRAAEFSGGDGAGEAAPKMKLRTELLRLLGDDDAALGGRYEGNWRRR